MRRVCLGMADRIVGISNITLDTFLAGRARRQGATSCIITELIRRHFVRQKETAQGFAAHWVLMKMRGYSFSPVA